MAHDVANEDYPSIVPTFAIWSVIVLSLLAGRFVALSLTSEIKELTKRVEALEAAK